MLSWVWFLTIWLGISDMLWGLQTSVIADILTFVPVYSQLLTHEKAIAGAAL